MNVRTFQLLLVSIDSISGPFHHVNLMQSQISTPVIIIKVAITESDLKGLLL